MFNDNGSAIWDCITKVKIISCTMSIRRTKCHESIAKVPECKDGEVSHIGNWPDDIDKKNVKFLGMLESKYIADALKRNHVFLHPAIKAPCANVIFESICCGLLVVYNKKVIAITELCEATSRNRICSTRFKKIPLDV